MEKRKRVFVGMSGGVDSSVAALLLKRQGYDVIGVFMRCYNIDGCAETDATDARRVAGHLGIPFYVWDFEEEYKKQVVDYMIRGYKAGLTPNPDVMCNREIKFGIFYKRAMEMGADYVATGHYVRRLRQHNTNLQMMSNTTNKQKPIRGIRAPFVLFGLYTAKDTNKDQSYFLWTLTQEQIAHSLFPIGDYLKPKVREIAKKAGLPTAEKKDSQGICFLGKVDVAEFLKQHIPVKTGDVVTVAGEKIGTHEGAHLYTIGQRHLGGGVRLGVMGDRRGAKNLKPYYVSDKNMKNNTVTVAEGDDNEALYQTKTTLTDMNFIDPNIASSLTSHFSSLRVLARVRYRQPLVSATLYNLSPIIYNLEFAEPVKFVAPGQSAVFYSEQGEMLGGGVIDK
jgi:tRNA-specific 2-thiouridylase